MSTKTFKAPTMLETLQMVQAELGASAIVISMRETPMGPAWNPWQKKGVEVVAAAPPPAPPREERPPMEWVSPPAPPRPASQPAPPSPSSPPQPAPALQAAQTLLTRQGVDAAHTQKIIALAQETLSPATLQNPTSCQNALQDLMSANLRTQKYNGSSVFCLVGASGSGKTSTMAKLALFLRQQPGKRLTWVCADTLRTGAVAQARAYADALSLPLQLIYTPQDAASLYRAAEPQDILLLDTPGYNPHNQAQMSELGALLAEFPRRFTCLTLPATTKEPDLEQAAASWGIFQLDALILTKLDETRTFGSLYNFARQSRLPLAFFASGSEAQALSPAQPARLIASLFAGEWKA